MIMDFPIFTSIYVFNRAECEKQVKGIKGAKFRKFTTEKEALDFIQVIKLMQRVKIHVSHSFLQSVSNQIHFMILSLPIYFYI